MKYIGELVDALTLFYDGNRGYIYEELKELKTIVFKNPEELAYVISCFIRNDALKHNLCPECYKALENETVLSNKDEAYGSTVSEIEYIRYCPNCGWRRR